MQNITRIWWLLMASTTLTGCLSQTLPKEQGLGVLTKNQPLGLANPSEYALEDGNLWQGAAYRIEGINLVYEGKENISPWAGKLVFFQYSLEPDLNSILTLKGPTPQGYGQEESMMQLRSDWMSEETGFTVGQSTKDKLKTIPWYKVSQMEEVTGFSVKQKEKSHELNYMNPFQESLDEVNIKIHYEGGGGKPSPRYVHQSLGSLMAGEKGTLEFPDTIQEENEDKALSRPYHFNSVYFELVQGDKTFSFEIR